MQNSQNDLEAIKRALNPREVLEELGVTQILESAGELRAFCPVHGSENQPSLAVRLSAEAARYTP